MRAWSFHLQIFFLGHRANQYLEMARLPQSVILDRSIYEDAYIFARALHHMGNINERDYFSYRRVFDQVVAGLPAPDLLIYLKAPVPVLMDRIHQRGSAKFAIFFSTLLTNWDWKLRWIRLVVMTLELA